ncbi:MAG: hypothetical protein IPN17_06085 [Deltaproteobacteria bacterium]|nr:hypothetical protein [Deltaproteobacteria bacterium]
MTVVERLAPTRLERHPTISWVPLMRQVRHGLSKQLTGSARHRASVVVLPSLACSQYWVLAAQRSAGSLPRCS